MHHSHEWHVAPWVWADLPEYAGHPAWSLWAGVYLHASADRAAHVRAGVG